MGKQFTVLSPFVDVQFQSPTGLRPYSAGQTVTLTDAEYAALTTSTTRTINQTSVTTVADPNRTTKDLQARPLLTNATVTGAASIAPGANFLTLTGNVTAVTPNGAAAGTETNYSVFLKQDATGSRLVTWGSKFKFAAGTAPTLSTGAGKVDLLRFATVDGGATVYNTDLVLDIR